MRGDKVKMYASVSSIQSSRVLLAIICLVFLTMGLSTSPGSAVGATIDIIQLRVLSSELGQVPLDGTPLELGPGLDSIKVQIDMVTQLEGTPGSGPWVTRLTLSLNDQQIDQEDFPIAALSSERGLNQATLTVETEKLGVGDYQIKAEAALFRASQVPPNAQPESTATKNAGFSIKTIEKPVVFQELVKGRDLDDIDLFTELRAILPGALRNLSDRCPSGPPRRIFGINALFKNISGRTFEPNHFKIDTLSGGNTVLNVDSGESGTVDSKISIPTIPAEGNRLVGPNETFRSFFWLCLSPDAQGNLQPFSFTVRAFEIIRPDDP